MKTNHRRPPMPGIYKVLIAAGFVAIGTLAYTIAMGGETQPQRQAAVYFTPSRTTADDSTRSTVTPMAYQAPENPDDYALILVNAQNPLTVDPDDIVNIRQEIGESCFLLKSDEMRANATASRALKTMLEGAKSQGIERFSVQSAYRGVEYQENLFSAEINKHMTNGLSRESAEASAALTVSRPGRSEHHTGLAFDIITLDCSDLYDFESTEQERWLKEHCWEYGFIQRYPPDKYDLTSIAHEPWHFRYVGTEHATAMKQSGQCLEEYLQEYNGRQNN